MQIRQMLVDSSKYKYKCPYSMNATRIIVHNTANDASANNEIKYMISNNNEVSFHIAVDDKEAVQGIPFDRNTWNAGDGQGKGNREGISIEICYSKSGGDRFIKAEQNAAKLIAQLLKERGWGIDKVTKHQDYSKKYCPHRTLDMGWDRFLNMIKAELGSSAENSASSPSSNVKTPTCTGNITYQSYDNVKKCWLPEVVNDNDYAGNLGNSMGGIRSKCVNGCIYMSTHVKGGSWLSTIKSDTYSKGSTNGNSYSGIMNKPIDGVKIWSDYGYVSYRVHLKNGSWLDWVHKADSTNDGYAGIYGREIDAIQMK